MLQHTTSKGIITIYCLVIKVWTYFNTSTITVGGATGGNEGSETSYTCSCCDIAFNTRHELRVHCNSELHRKKVMMDEERDWKYRPPPRGLTSREYSKCPRLVSSDMSNMKVTNLCLNFQKMVKLGGPLKIISKN